MKRNLFALTTLSVSLLLAHAQAHATNGYFLPGYGFRSQGMGGVGIAYGRDSLSIAANPANVLKTGMRGDLGFGIFNPERHAMVGQPAGNLVIAQDPSQNPIQGVSPFGFIGDVESDAKYFIVPEMGFTMSLSEKVSVGLAVVANGGMNTTYPENFFSYPGFTPNVPPKDQKIGVDMMQLLVPITLGYKVNDNHSIGAALVLAETRFRAYGLEAFKYFDQNLGFTISFDPEHLTGQGFDYSYGAGFKLGWQGEFVDDKLTLGLVYSSRTYMTRFDKYRGLFAEQGDFDIPENYGIGIAFKPAKNLLIAADVLRINYSEIASIGNRGPSTSIRPYGGDSPINGVPSIPDKTKELGKDDGMGFGWENMTVYKVGVQYGVNNKLQVRAGFNYGKTPIPNDQITFNTLAPATVEKHYSVGFTYKPSDNLEVTGTYMYVASNSQQSPLRQNLIGAANIDMHQNVFGLSLGWVLDHGPEALDEYGETNWDGINFDGWYSGFGFGQSRYRDLGVTTANTRTEGWKVYSGYQFNKYLGAEGGYANLNDMTATNGTARAEIESEAWSLAAVGSYPLTDKFSVMAKFGAAYVLTNTSTKVGTALAQRSGDDSYQPYYGLGVKYALLDNVDIRAEWDRFDLDDYNIDLMTAGFAVRF